MVIARDNDHVMMLISGDSSSSINTSEQTSHDGAVKHNQLPLSSPSQAPIFSQNLLGDLGTVVDVTSNANRESSAKAETKHQCWDHGCNGREFASKSNLMRHMKEKAGKSTKVVCPLCGGCFTRNSARDTHLAKQSCNRIRRYSNGRLRPSKVALLSNPNLVEGVHY